MLSESKKKKHADNLNHRHLSVQAICFFDGAVKDTVRQHHEWATAPKFSCLKCCIFNLHKPTVEP